MHLSTKQIILLLSPLLLSLFVYYFSVDIASYTRYLFPSYQEYTNKTLDIKTEYYLKIDSKEDTYQTIIKRIKDRKLYAGWIAEDVLYQEKEKIEKESTPKSTEKKKTKAYVWRLEAVFPNKKVAIINSKVVKVSSSINGAVLLQVKSDKALLKTLRGNRWIHLFR